MNRMIESYYWASFDNGYEGVLKKILDEILETKRNFNFFEFKEKEKDSDLVVYAEITYSFLVELWGSCGVSSRGGWIEKENLKYIEELRNFCIEHNDEEDEYHE